MLCLPYALEGRSLSRITGGRAIEGVTLRGLAPFAQFTPVPELIGVVDGYIEVHEGTAVRLQLPVGAHLVHVPVPFLRGGKHIRGIRVGVNRRIL